MKSSKIAISVVLFFFSLVVSSQNTKKGKVVSCKTNIPLDNVNIYNPIAKEGTTSTMNGEFNYGVFKNLSASDSITISLIGYEKKVLSLSQLIEANFQVCLDEKIQTLDEVVVTTNLIPFRSNVQYLSLSKLKKKLYDFSTVVQDDKIIVLGGNESYKQNNLKKRLKEDPTLSIPGSTISDLVRNLPGNLDWNHYNDAIYIYDINLDSWSEIDMKISPRSNHKSVIYNDKIYVIGGRTLSKNLKHEYLEGNIDIVDIENKSSKIDSTNPHKAVNFGVVSQSNYMILFGGSVRQKSNGLKEFTKKVHLYDFSSGYWYKLKDMSVAKETSGVLFDDKIYFVGGLNNKPLKEIESYNIKTQKTLIEAELFQNIANPGVTGNGQTIYIMDKGSLFTFHVGEKILKEYSIDLQIECPKLIVHKQYLYVMGGFYQDGNSIFPSDKMIKIKLNDLKRTKIKRKQVF